jgi:hypothetical protein
MRSKSERTWQFSLKKGPRCVARLIGSQVLTVPFGPVIVYSTSSGETDPKLEHQGLAVPFGSMSQRPTKSLLPWGWEPEPIKPSRGILSTGSNTVTASLPALSKDSLKSRVILFLVTCRKQPVRRNVHNTEGDTLNNN